MAESSPETNSPPFPGRLLFCRICKISTLLIPKIDFIPLKKMEKLEAVQKVLRFSTPTREWCTKEFSVYFDDFDEQNVDDYTTGGYGDIADEILERGLDEQII